MRMACVKGLTSLVPSRDIDGDGSASVLLIS